MNIQALIDSMNESASRERANYHLTLGKLEAALIGVPGVVRWKDDPDKGPRSFDSYRGHYVDLALDDGNPQKASDLLELAREADGRAFTGYKGGDYTMTERTPLWRSEYGSVSSMAIMSAERDSDDLLLVCVHVDD